MYESTKLCTGPLIMGVVNVTPDSFYDGGRYNSLEAALHHAQDLLDAGADVLDIGGESTRPGAVPVEADEESARILPVIKALATIGAVISVDTQKPEVFLKAFDVGAKIWNDVSGLTYSAKSVATAALTDCDLIIMHRQGEPQTMQAAPAYVDVVAEVEEFLLQRAHAAIDAGVAKSKIWLDPGIGFGKSLDHSLSLIKATKRLSSHGFPLLMAASNKRFIAALEERENAKPSEADQRLGGTIAAHLYAISQGAKMVRVHNVKAMKQALRLWQCL
jgi:dihydropteroate synthase